MDRRTARNHALNLIFLFGFHENMDVDRVFDNYIIDHGLEESRYVDKEFIYQEFNGVSENLEEIDNYIETNLTGWTMDRLNNMDIAIMRLAIYEILYMDELSYSISVNEAVELAKTFSADESPGFVNGVLGSVVKTVEENELK